MRLNTCKKLYVFVMLSLLSSLLQATEISSVLPNAQLPWFVASNLPAGAKLVVLAGNPNKHELYVARLKLPANFVVPAHSHISDEYDTVISGTYYLGIGNSMNQATAIALPAGSFMTLPAGALHYGFTKEETVLEITGIGPWGTIPKHLKHKS